MVRPGAFVRTLLLCGLAMTTLSFAKTNQAPTVNHPIRFTVSQPMSTIPQSLPSPDFDEHEVRLLDRHLAIAPGTADPALQTQFGPQISGTQGLDFEGIGVNGGEPSDNNIAVGPNHIVDIVNSEWAVYDKSGHIAAGFPKSLGSIWTSLGGACTGNQGDPIVQYDRLADRWLLSQIGSESAPYSLCIAVSKSGDPTSTYSLYEYSFGNNFPDYPHYSVWPTTTNSAYLQMAHLFQNLQSFVGTAACAYDRAAMIAGKAKPVQICFTISNDGGFQPSDLDGSTAPPDGSPGYFTTFETTSLHQFQLTPNFANPSSSTFTGPINIPVSSFSLACGGSGGTCVPQKGTTATLDTLGDRMMFRMAYRNFGDHEALVVNHTVASGSSSGAPRWYEIRTPNNTPTVFQQGTYAPDSTFRWMASMALDKAGDIFLSYSTSSTSIDPSIAYTGRVPSDSLGTMESENTLLVGKNFQTGHSRWGDYSAAHVDPSDDCTFWFTQQYMKTSGDFSWGTHIGSFKFTACGGGGGAAVTLTPTSLKWGKVTVGVKGAAKKVTVTNSGTATLNITNVATTGDFALVPLTSKKACGSTLAAGASCIVKVSFTPTQTGTRTGNLTFTDNAPDSPQNVALTGTGK
jgi:Abnormal spindle-like microcephaly-assoc'd, ASPM-SPD-2-Hydin